MSDFDELFEKVRAERREAKALAAERGPEPVPVVPLAGYELMRALGSWALKRYLDAGIAPTFPAGTAGLWSPPRVVPRPAPEPRRWWQRRPPAGPAEYERAPDLWEIFSYQYRSSVEGEYVPGDPGMYGSGSSGYYERRPVDVKVVICVDREGNLASVREGHCFTVPAGGRLLAGVMMPDDTVKINVMNTVDRIAGGGIQ
ncbi:hypothetical protein KNE206_53950 [Kitasatospora sp. NE20-6]|uniref:hypothetical protein n=1 Tax=Kitasatospora sp. NE20-6 TaxID=2859066 RepID=UPI0034DB8DF8